jgi:hypothetical protein
MSLHGISASTALPPTFTRRQRAELYRHDGRAAAARSASRQSGIVFALGAALALGLLLGGVFAPAHAEVMPNPVHATDHVAAVYPAAESSGAIVQVYKYDGSVQCGGPGVSLAKMADELTHRGVHVIAMRKGTDGLLHPYICGAPDGVINVFEIDARGLSEAEALGFKPLTPPAH